MKLCHNFLTAFTLVSAVLCFATSGLAANNTQIEEDITNLFTYTWGSGESLSHNDDGSITFNAQTWGGLAAWLVNNGIPADWSEYDKVVFEFSAPTTVNTQILVEEAKAWGEVGIMSLECLFEGKNMSQVQQIALQTSAPATLIITRVYLVRTTDDGQGNEDSDDDDGGNPELSQLVINEIMQSNIDCLLDDLNEFPDSWVELYNNSEQSVNLAEYSISPSEKISKAWQLPYQIVAPHQYAMVYCDKEGSQMHADFRIDSGKDGAVYLFHNDELIDMAKPGKKQPAPNIAYGRITNGATEWGYMQKPTPMNANCGVICSKILGQPVFSETGKVFQGTHPFTLSLSLPEDSPEGTVIRYTVDGSEPTELSSLYVSPINIRTTRCVRAKLFCEGWLSPRSTTHSYIFFPREITLPVVSLVTDNKYFYDNKVGIYVDGTYGGGHKNYEYDWRRPVNFEFFEGEDQESALNQLGETRVQGGASRSAQLKSLIVYANKRFGQKRLDYEFFPDQKPGLTDFKSIILRNAGNDFDYLYMRDAVIQRVMAEHTDLDWQAWRPAVIYINGTYKGILNIRERSTADNIYTNYDGLEDIDMLENWYEVKEGNADSWNAFVDFYNEHGHTLAEYEEWIDWKEFINLMVMNLYYNNQDFPGNNIVMWRPKAENGVWRFVAKDTDFGLGLYGTKASYNTIEWIYNPNYDSNHNWANTYEATKLFRRMMEDEDFKREFIDRAAIYMGDFMNETGTRAVWDPMYEIIKTEYPHHRELINRWWPDYSQELNSARLWIKQRTSYFYQHLAGYYKLGTPVKMEINKDVDEEDLVGVSVSFNGVTLSKGTFDGKFFPAREVSLESTPINGKQVTAWHLTEVSSSGTQEKTIEGSSCSFQMPTCTRLIVKAVVEDDSGMENVVARQWHWQVENGQVTLRDVPAGTQAMLYNHQGMIVARTTVKADGQLGFTLPNKGIYILKVGEKTLKFEF